MKNSEQPINPQPHENNDGTISHNVYLGLTKREYFAGLAMQSMVSMSTPDVSDYQMQLACQDAVKWADFMLAELEKPL